MQVVDVSPWPQWLERAALNERQKTSFAITVRWYLSFCARGRGGVSLESARAFIAWAERTKRPQPWQLEGWKEAIRWLFRAATTSGGSPSPPPGGTPDPPRSKTAGPSAEPEDPGGGAQIPARAAAGSGPPPVPAWKKAFLTTVRRRHYAYRTEQSYLVWLERFARFCQTEDLASRGPEDVKQFLDSLAAEERVGVATQRQAFTP